MFEQLFEGTHALVRQRNGPLADERRRYLVHCAEQQMSRRTLRDIAIYTLIVARDLRLADRPGERITRAEIEATADRWANRHPRPPMMRDTRLAWLRFARHATCWLTFLDRLQLPVPAPRPYANHVARFTDYMLRERGLSPRTVAYRCRAIEDFLNRLTTAKLGLDTVTVAQVDDLLACQVREEGYARVTVQTYASTLRAFFRFAEASGWCRPGLAAAVMAPRVFPHEGLPVGPSWDDVNRVLLALAGGEPAHVRDRALVLLLAVYGLRAGEVIALRLDDFDWEREVLTVPHGKRQKPRIYPLCRPVGEAVLRYLREVRPASARREVFLTLCAPFRPLPCGALGRAVSRRLHALGVTLPHYGPHLLPTILPKRPPPFIPHIYSREELKRLLLATETYQRNRSTIEPVTMRAIVLVLYGAGLRLREVVNLSIADVDFGNAVLTIRDTKFFKTRLVPISRELCAELTRYSNRPGAGTTGDRSFFTTRSGGRVNPCTIEGCFQRVREHADVRRSPEVRYQPRLHDLRHTFAVHRLTQWYRQGADVQRLIYHLSVYLGHDQLSATQVYLTMTPELLALAAARFERYARGEGGHA